MENTAERKAAGEESPEEISPSERSIILYRYLEDGRELRKKSKSKKDSYAWYYKDWKKYYFPEAKKIVRDYTARDVREVLFHRLNGFYVEGINKPHFVDPEVGPITQKVLDVDPQQIEYEWAYKESFGKIKEFQRIITRERFLKRKGLSEDEIEGYGNEFREILLNAVLPAATEYLKTPESMEVMGEMLDYCKDMNLIKEADYLSLISVTRTQATSSTTAGNPGR